MDIHSDDYHDFVIKDGKILGEFEQMYRKVKNVPWHQNEQEGWIDINLAINLLNKYGPFERISDFGCGLGYFLDILKRHLGSARCRTFGYDISPTCCSKGRRLFPDAKFFTLDLMQDLGRNYKKRKRVENTKELFAIRGTLWYVFPKIKNVVNNIASFMNTGDFLFISQNFPPLDKKFVGKEVIYNPESLTNWFTPFFAPLETIFYQDMVSRGNDSWFMGVFSKK